MNTRLRYELEHPVILHATTGENVRGEVGDTDL